ncbi:MAG: carotenoid oxygenase family protein [Deltaproteobacteria bacterium]
MSRRRFLGGALAAAGVAALPSLVLPGCGGSSAGVPELVVDPSIPWWLQNNFAPVVDEVEAFDLPIRGALPPELSGVYARNGSNPQSGDSTHWFLGDGMVHGLRLEGGAARWYRNRYIDTPYYRAGSDYRDGLGPPLRGNHQANVSLIHHGGKLLASGEVGAPYIIDPETMETIGWTDFEGELSASFTAHAKIDPATGYLHFFGYFFAPPFLRYYVADTTGRVIHASEIPVAASTMMHSFAITESDVVFWEGPVLFGAPDVPGGFPFVWDESYGARIGIMPLGGRGEEIRWVEIPPCYVFHELNAYREGSDIVLDVCRHSKVMDGERIGSQSPRLHRWRVGTAAAELTFREEILADDIGLEFPYGDKRVLGRKHRHGWFVEFREHPDTIDPGSIVHLDLQTGARAFWDAGAARQAGEAIFVPGGAGEGEGWLLSIVYDRASDVSDLVVLDALNVAAGPVAEVRLPQRVPFGFHGTWIPDSAR